MEAKSSKKGRVSLNYKCQYELGRMNSLTFIGGAALLFCVSPIGPDFFMEKRILIAQKLLQLNEYRFTLEIHRKSSVNRLTMKFISFFPFFYLCGAILQHVDRHAMACSLPLFPPRKSDPPSKSREKSDFTQT